MQRVSSQEGVSQSVFSDQYGSFWYLPTQDVDSRLPFSLLSSTAVTNIELAVQKKPKASDSGLSVE